MELLNYTALNRKHCRIDYHIHSLLSSDGRATIFQLCERAQSIRLDEIGVADHLDLEPSDEGYGFFDYSTYTAIITQTRRIFGDRLVIRKGIEVDYQSIYEEEIRHLLKGMSFDYTIGSIHYLDHQLISPDLIARKGLKWVYEVYLKEVTSLAKSKLFQVIGHYDLVQKYLNSSGAAKFVEEREAALDEIISNNLFLEVNTKNLMDTYGDTVPRKSLVETYFRRGGRLFSIGSDAHFLEHVGIGVDEVRDFLAKLGKDEVRMIFEESG